MNKCNKYFNLMLMPISWYVKCKWNRIHLSWFCNTLSFVFPYNGKSDFSYKQETSYRVIKTFWLFKNNSVIKLQKDNDTLLHYFSLYYSSKYSSRFDYHSMWWLTPCLSMQTHLTMLTKLTRWFTYIQQAYFSWILRAR